MGYFKSPFHLSLFFICAIFYVFRIIEFKKQNQAKKDQQFFFPSTNLTWVKIANPVLTLLFFFYGLIFVSGFFALPGVQYFYPFDILQSILTQETPYPLKGILFSCLLLICIFFAYRSFKLPQIPKRYFLEVNPSAILLFKQKRLLAKINTNQDFFVKLASTYSWDSDFQSTDAQWLVGILEQGKEKINFVVDIKEDSKNEKAHYEILNEPYPGTFLERIIIPISLLILIFSSQIPHWMQSITFIGIIFFTIIFFRYNDQIYPLPLRFTTSLKEDLLKRKTAHLISLSEKEVLSLCAN